VDPDKRDEAELEEERFARTLSHQKMHGRNAFAATHAVPPKKNPQSPNGSQTTTQSGNQSSPGLGDRGPRVHKKEPSGPLPEWKKQQLEREEAEKKRREEEEQRRKEYTVQIVNSATVGHSTVETSSAITGNFVDPLVQKAAQEKKQEKEPEVVPGRAIFDDKDKEEELKREEQYLMRRTGSTGPVKRQAVHSPSSSFSGDATKDAHLALHTKQVKVMVAWVDNVTGEVKSQLPFFATGGRLPMVAVEGALGIKNLVVKESKQPLTAGPDGFSTVSIGNGKIYVEVLADPK